MRYKKMIEEARKRGVATERAMEESIEDVDCLLEEMREEHPEEYWSFMRKAHERMYGCHYDEEYAKKDLEKIWWTDKEGRRHEGPHWSKEEVRVVMQGKPMPAGTTDCDKWVAANVMYADLNRGFGEAEIIDAAYLFFFADDDGCEGKIWRYMAKM